MNPAAQPWIAHSLFLLCGVLCALIGVLGIWSALVAVDMGLLLPFYCCALGIPLSLIGGIAALASLGSKAPRHGAVQAASALALALPWASAVILWIRSSQA